MQPAPPTPPSSNPAMARIETSLQDRGLALPPPVTPPADARSRSAAGKAGLPLGIPVATVAEAVRVA
jgi:hypothetical protein